MVEYVIQLTCPSPLGAPTLDEASAPVRVFLSDIVAIATLWFNQRGLHCVYGVPSQAFSVKSRAPRDCHAKMYLVVSGKSARFEYDPDMPPMGSPLQPFVVFSFAIFTPDMYCVSVFNQISPWSSAQMLANGAASAASRPLKTKY